MKNLQIGKYYKSIKELCLESGLEYKDSTCSRKAIIKEIERYYLLEKQGRGYTPLEKYDAPRKKIDNRKNNGNHNNHNTKYGTLLDQLLLDWLFNANTFENAITTRNQLYLKNDELINIPLFSKEYKKLQNNGYGVFAKNHSMSKGLVLTYNQKVRKITETHLEIVLKRLQKQDIIQWQKEIMIKKFSTQELEIADAKLEEEIKKVENNTYETLKISPFQRVNPQINFNFIREVCKNFNDLSSYWRVYNIDILDDEVIKNSLLDDEQRIEMINELIIRYVKSTIQAVKNKKNKNSDGSTFKPYTSEKYIDDIDKLNRMIWLLPEGYKTESEKLIEEFISMGEDIDIDW